MIQILIKLFIIIIKHIDICNFLLKYKNNKFIFGGNNGVYIIKNFENESELVLNKKDIIIPENFKVGIKINEYLFAFLSNENKIIFYNLNFKEVTKTLSEYSIISSPNNSLLMDIESKNINYNKLILCACKKNINGYERGLLLIYRINENIYYNFYAL